MMKQRKRKSTSDSFPWRYTVHRAGRCTNGKPAWVVNVQTGRGSFPLAADANPHKYVRQPYVTLLVKLYETGALDLAPGLMEVDIRHDDDCPRHLNVRPFMCNCSPWIEIDGRRVDLAAVQ